MSIHKDLFKKVEKETYDKKVQATSSNELMPTKVKDSNGNEIDLTSVKAISLFGLSRAENQNTVGSNLLEKTMVSDTGIISDKLMQIVSLTKKVDIKSLDSKGVFGFLKNRFQDAKTKVVAQYTTVAEQIDKTVENLKKNIEEMYEESNWLENQFNQNKIEIMLCREDYATISKLYSQAESNLNSLVENQSNAEDIQEARLIVNALGKQTDILHKVLHLNEITASEIKSMQVSNMNNIEKYQSIVTATIPLWKKKLSLGIQAQKDQERIEAGRMIDEFTNGIVKDTAKMSSTNMIQSANANQDNVISTSSLVEATDIIGKAITEVIAIEKTGNQKRKEEQVKLNDAMERMKLALKGK